MKISTNRLNIPLKYGMLFMLALMVGSLLGQTTTFKNSWSRQGISMQSQNKQSVKLNFSVESFSRLSLDINGEQMEKINIEGSLLPNNEGAPDLPVINRYVAIPQGSTVKVNILNSRKERVENINVSPAARIPLDTERGPLDYSKDMEIYSQNSLYPSQAVIVSKPLQIRGLDMVLVSVNPMQYNPVTKQMIVNRDLQIEIEFVGGNGHFGEDKYRNRFWDPILSDAVINSESLEFDYQKANRELLTGCEYLIIVPDDAAFIAWADTIRMFRQKQGILSQVVTITEVGGNTTSAIETYIDNAYSNWDIPPIAVLLLADYGNSGVGITSPVYDNYCISDNIYADINNNTLPDITFARMTARNETELEILVHKAINYERNPPTNPDFYKNPITAMGWQTERWFQLCSEIVAGYFENVHGKTPVRENAIYDGNANGPWSSATNTATIVSYFGESGLGYIPDSPSFLTDWGGSANRVNSDINSGAFILQHRDHGNVTIWGEPSYGNSDVAGLTNTDLTYIFSINCLTGKFNDSGECLTEKFHRSEFAALGVIGASETSYSFVNDTYVWGMYDNMWPDFMPDEEENPLTRGVLPAFGNVAGKIFLQQSGWPYNSGNKEVTYYLFHAHGDAFTQVYYEVPQNLTVNHNDVILGGLTSFTVTSDTNSFICLTVGDQIIGTAEGTGEAVEIEIIPQDPGTVVDIVITKQNYYRYEQSLEVIPTDGPYCVYDDHQINDSLSNNNGIVEYGEDILISMVVENLGNDLAAGVVVEITSDNEYCIILDSIENYDTILAASMVNREFAYKIKIANNIPDQTDLEFDVISVDELDSIWSSKLVVTVAAPLINVGEFVIDDSELGNDNGILEPGETADIKIFTENNGHCNIQNVMASLTPYNNFITVNTETQIIPDLDIFDGIWVVYNVSVADETPNPVIAEMRFNASAGAYSAEKTYFPRIGQFYEDWETGDFEKYNWIEGGNSPWQISSDLPYEGVYHAVSGDINDSQTSKLSISYEVMSDDVIKFMRKVSTESGYDYLKFSIDGNVAGSWAGSQSYSQEEYPVTAGVHTFMWEYAKDYSTTGGSDKVWIDNIELPTMMVTTLFAGHDADACAVIDFVCDASSTNYNSILWTTSGDGAFNDETLLNPSYIPGENDIVNGEVILTISIVDNDAIELSDNVTLTFTNGPVAPNMPEGEDYIDVFKVSETSYTTNFIEGNTGYTWEVSPSEAGELFTNNNESTIFWNPDFMGDVTLKVNASNECGEGDFSEELNIFVDNTVGLDLLGSSIKLEISPNPNNGVFKIDIATENKEDISIKMINYLGVTIYEIQNVSASHGFTKTFDNRNLSSGVYLININQGNKTYCRKLIIN